MGNYSLMPFNKNKNGKVCKNGKRARGNLGRKKGGRGREKRKEKGKKEDETREKKVEKKGKNNV